MFSRQYLITFVVAALSIVAGCGIAVIDGEPCALAGGAGGEGGSGGAEPTCDCPEPPQLLVLEAECDLPGPGGMWARIELPELTADELAGTHAVVRYVGQSVELLDGFTQVGAQVLIADGAVATRCDLTPDGVERAVVVFWVPGAG